VSARYTRVEIARILRVDTGFVAQLEREEIIRAEDVGEAFSEQMLERVRVAHNLVTELEVNLAGVAIILRMREQMSTLHEELEQMSRALHSSLKNRS
jgi:MerR family transcriptional regulator/heat shock protein HspR